jgi:hypothetical protein
MLSSNSEATFIHQRLAMHLDPPSLWIERHAKTSQKKTKKTNQT